jgi:methylmalonyl-CoA decarboxylase
MSVLSVTTQGAVVTATMTNAHRRNALNRELMGALMAAMEAADAAGARAFILRAEPGVTVWSAGHDIDELPTDRSDPLTWENPLEQLLHEVRQLPYPVIAAVEGGVWGGACDLAFTCDLVVAVRSSTFAITPAKLGVPYNTAGVAHFLWALPLHTVKEMFFTANPISAELAAEHGLVNRLVDDADQMAAAADELAQRIASLAPLVVRAVKAELTALTDASPMTPDVFERLTSLRRAAWRSSDYQEGIAAFKERRPARFTGS